MTPGSASRDVNNEPQPCPNEPRPSGSGPCPSPVLVLGLGNTLLGDDGAGVFLVEELSQESGWSNGVEFLDGGTQGLALLGRIGSCRALVVLDALAMGAAPGTVSLLKSPGLIELGARRAETAHEGNAGELLAAAALLGDLPGQVFVLGIEPQFIRTGAGLSDPVRRALPRAKQEAHALITAILRQWL